MINGMIELPDCRNADFTRQLMVFGELLEKAVRPGCPFDLKTWPNLLWQKIEEKMLQGWQKFLQTEVSDRQVLMLQWYNSGVFFKTGQLLIGCDIVPIPRYYGWPEPDGLSREMAEHLDLLLVTHNHQDHFDEKLVNECLSRNCPVKTHPQAFPQVSATAMHSNETVQIEQVHVKAHHCRHVWRESEDEVPLTTFEIHFADFYRLLFCGDADYTREFHNVKPGLDSLFITWRNPGPEFEDGHPRQKATTTDAIKIAVNNLNPQQLLLEHYGELDHIYKGFPASYDLAAKIIAHFPGQASILFWGDSCFLKE